VSEVTRAAAPDRDTTQPELIDATLTIAPSPRRSMSVSAARDARSAAA
jgi:hypothetical protein